MPGIKQSTSGHSRIRFSGIVIFLLAGLFIARDIQLADYDKKKRVFEGDVLHYYAYLPALLVFNDLKLDFVRKQPSRFSNRFWPVHAENGNYVIMTTMGMSVLYAPFIVPTHYFLVATGQEANGYSRPYKIAILLGAVFYVTLALLMIRKLLSPYFSDTVIALVLLSITLGTNLVYYTTHEAALSHAYSFFLITWFLFNTVRYYKHPGIVNAALIGLSAGLIALVRPTNALVFLLFPAWGIGNKEDLINRTRFLLIHWKHILVITVVIMLTWVPQVLYWKMTSGQLFFNGYGDGGRFFFNNPQFINILFSYRKGWLLYTPIMILTVFGFYWLFRTNRGVFFPVVLFFILNTYVLASWWLWWFGGSYGNRAFIDMYGVLSFPLAAFYSHFLMKRYFIIKTIPFLLSAVFIAHNLFQQEQYRHSAIDYVSMTKEAYWDSFGNIKPSNEFRNLLVFPDYQAAKNGYYPKPVVKKKFVRKEQRTPEYFEQQIRNSPEQMKLMKDKSILKGISIDSAIKQDALWLYENID